MNVVTGIALCVVLAALKVWIFHDLVRDLTPEGEIK